MEKLRLGIVTVYGSPEVFHEAIRAYQRAMARQAGDVAIIESVKLAIVASRQPAALDAPLPDGRLYRFSTIKIEDPPVQPQHATAPPVKHCGPSHATPAKDTALNRRTPWQAQRSRCLLHRSRVSRLHPCTKCTIAAVKRAERRTNASLESPLESLDLDVHIHRFKPLLIGPPCLDQRFSLTTT